jgi:L-seryl-tRNA(Ser) seleniumtransferase
MLAAPPDALEARARRLVERLKVEGIEAQVVETSGAVGGGTYPGVELPSRAVSPRLPCSADHAAERLRAGAPPVVGRIVDDRLLLDVRTVGEGEEEKALVRGLVGLRDALEAE